MDQARLMSRKCTMLGFVIQLRCTRWVERARNRFCDSVLFVLVLGCLFPQQLILSTSVTRSNAEKSCFRIAISRRLISARCRRTWTSTHRKPSRRQIDRRPLGSSSYYQKLSGNKHVQSCLRQPQCASLRDGILGILIEPSKTDADFVHGCFLRKFSLQKKTIFHSQSLVIGSLLSPP